MATFNFLFRNSILLRTGRILYFIAALIIFGAISYLFGHSLLSGATHGNDFPYAITVITWLDRFFPGQPLWFPLWGGGLSIVQNSQLGAFYLPIIVERLSNLTLIQAFRLWPFLSVPLTSLGIYFFVWYKLKSQTAALLASFFYPLSQASWTWLYDTGLYSQSVSLIFVLPVIFTFDLYLTSSGEKKYFWLVVSSLSLTMLSYTHFASGLSIMETVFLYSFFASFFDQNKRVGLARAVSGAILVIFLSVLLVGFWLFPYLRYFSIVNRGGLLFPGLSALPHFKIGGILGLLGPQESLGTETAWYMFFATPVVIWSGIGLIFGILRKKMVFGWAIISFFFMLQTSLPDYLPVLPSVIERFWTVVGIRAIVPTMVFLPMVAAFGAEELSKSILRPFRNIQFLKIVVVSVLVTLSIIFLRHSPAGIEDYLGLRSFGSYLGYGPAGFYGAILKDGKIGIAEGNVLTPWQLSQSAGLSFEPLVRRLNTGLSLTVNDRVDISPNWGGIIQSWSNFSKVPLSTTYNVAGLPDWPFWGYQQGVFYNKESPGTTREVDELAQYFGITHVILYRGITPVERFDQDWEETWREPEALTVLKYKKATSLVEITNRPTILVIGSKSHNAYETIFRLANLGMVDYRDALLVEGREKVDDYSPAELRNFSSLFLYGYSFNNRSKGWQMLADYVKTGGKLFVETGWQYVDSDWQMKDVPDVLPISEVSWEEFRNWDIQGFSPPVYKDGPWSVSSGKGLKSWAQQVLGLNGRILIAKGDYGKGKIVWSGMNLPGHAFIYKNETEYKFLKELISWLIPFGGEIRTDVSMTRDYSDRVEFTLPKTENKFFYFKANAFPDWKARFAKGGELPVYQTGPNQILIPLIRADEGERLILEYKPSSIVIFSRILSLFVLLFLIVWPVLKKLFIPRDVWEKVMAGTIKKWWEKE